uniref:Uncharacterized protein n=1 Tax=Anguilla anguilla TaxID=7936 RepID=A0A0E9TLH8_ANGAN
MSFLQTCIFFFTNFWFHLFTLYKHTKFKETEEAT